MSLSAFLLNDELKLLKQRGLYRVRRVIDSAQGTEIVIDGKKLLNFCSNDYLGLANHPSVITAFKQAVDNYGVGSGSAHLICGHSTAHHALEEELAAFTGRERALLFSTGYMANMGVISALLDKNDLVLEDKLNHASLLDGGLLSGAFFKRYLHANSENLQAKITQATAKKTLIVSDGVFSMDGDLALLPELVEISNKNQAGLMIDDAHGLGVLGKNGAGVVEHFACSQNDVPILIGTFGKAFGTAGAFVAGSEELIETLIQKARTYIYTTAMPAAIAQATRASLQIVIYENWRREKLKALVKQFRSGAAQLGLTLMDSDTPIQPLLIGDTGQAVILSQQLLELGCLVSAIRPPTVPQGKARLRITFSANHQASDVEFLLTALEKAAKNPLSCLS
jgi:8-amino-7-oxononanoate synthase